jgi:archaetidylserine synthase
MIKLIKLPDLITVLSALFGFFAILVAGYDLLRGCFFILLAVITDGVDGLLARKIEQSKLGKNLDSFADFLSFGIAPAFILILYLPDSVTYGLSGAFIVCGMLRLARYNVFPGDNFEGFPITASGMMLSLLVIVDANIFLLPAIAILCILMVSSIPYPKLPPKISLTAGFILGIMIVLYFLEIELWWNLSFVVLGLLFLYLASPVRKWKR